MERLKIDDKYEIVVDLDNNNSEFKCLRYGEEWRDLVGDNLFLSMFYRIQELEEQLKEQDKVTKEMLHYLKPEYYINKVKSL